MKITLQFCIVILSVLHLNAQSVSYIFSAPNAVHHEAEISVEADKLPLGPAIIRMSRSSPGRYAKHEFGKNVYNVKAFDEKGNPLKVEKTDADIYAIHHVSGKVKVTYTLYGNYQDGTYVGIDATGFHLNMPATFMWFKGLEKAPMALQFVLNNTAWKIATQLPQGKDALSFTAPDLQYFMDSPTKVGNLQFKEWTITNPDKKSYIFRIALDANANTELLGRFALKVERMVQEAQAVFGEVPAYDYGTYTFLATINPYVNGDGMEHRNSTMITLPTVFDGSDNLLGVFSHEFFHCWNVERIRPADLEPFNFEKNNMSEGLWVAEGFTQYYGDLILMRAGFESEEDFLQNMGQLVNTKVNSPGAQLYNPIENSQRAVFVDAGVSIDKNNFSNMYASYYPYGGALALALDLDLRSNFKGLTLDNFMQKLWAIFGKTARPYKVIDLQTALAQLTNTTYANSFFTKYVYGHQALDYTKLFEKAGYSLKTVSPGRAWAGKASLSKNMAQLTSTIINTPLYIAGVDVDDVITSVDGKSINSEAEFNAVIGNHRPGESVAISYKHRGNTINTTLLLQENPMLDIEPAKQELNISEKTFKQAWLATKVKE